MIRHLLIWYGRHKRDLPWRRSSDPYRIMVSEFMLVQTTVATVLKRYDEFLREFPTLNDLAQAPLWRVRKAWTGLGYNSRAENLWKACRLIKQMGQFPETPEALKKLPGFGPYLAHAVPSIAFNVRAPACDANVKRVLLRVFDAEDPGILEALFAGTRRPPSELNQALMELGALVCKPREPQCPHCPIKTFCLTRGPHPQEMKRVRAENLELLISVCRDSLNRVLLVRRESRVLFLKNCWGLPAAMMSRCRQRPKHPTFRHAIMRWKIHAHVQRGGLASMEPGLELKWVEMPKLNRFLFSSLWWKALRAAGLYF